MKRGHDCSSCSNAIFFFFWNLFFETPMSFLLISYFNTLYCLVYDSRVHSARYKAPRPSIDPTNCEGGATDITWCKEAAVPLRQICSWHLSNCCLSYNDSRQQKLLFVKKQTILLFHVIFLLRSKTCFSTLTLNIGVSMLWDFVTMWWATFQE
jgi:hypothetical protein